MPHSRLFYSGASSGEKREIERLTTMKAVPGLNAFEDDPEKAVDTLAPLFVHAATVVPPEYHSETLVYVQATAGMRLVPDVSIAGNHNRHDSYSNGAFRL